MAIAQCACGKRIGVSDALVGKTVKCPECGEKVVVGGGGAKPRSSPAQHEGPQLHISPGLIGVALVLVLGVGGTVLLKMGPIRVANQWGAISHKADGEVNDVVSFALQAYLSQHHMYNPTKSNRRPGVDGDVNFDFPYLVMSMPERVPFTGLTDQGKFAGYYRPATGELDADISIGGSEVGGLMVMRSATDVFHIKGRDVNGNPQAESDGTPLTIYYPLADPDGQ
jgi:DNA-directed RNA polymerase subunit RPC12/RpoP